MTIDFLSIFKPALPPAILETMPSASGAADISSPPIERERSAVSYTYDNIKGWKSMRVLRIGRGMYHDVRRRLPYYCSDIRDAWTYRTVASIIRMYFVKYVSMSLQSDTILTAECLACFQP